MRDESDPQYVPVELTRKREHGEATSPPTGDAAWTRNR
jgi:hypothetical protein